MAEQLDETAQEMGDLCIWIIRGEDAERIISINHDDGNAYPMIFPTPETAMKYVDQAMMASALQDSEVVKLVHFTRHCVITQGTGETQPGPVPESRVPKWLRGSDVREFAIRWLPKRMSAWVVSHQMRSLFPFARAHRPKVDYAKRLKLLSITGRLLSLFLVVVLGASAWRWAYYDPTMSFIQGACALGWAATFVLYSISSPK